MTLNYRNTKPVNQLIMKKLTLVPVVMIMLGTFSLYGQTHDDLQGVWKMIYKKWELSDTVIERSEYVFPSYKIFFEDHFSLSRIDEENHFIIFPAVIPAR